MEADWQTQEVEFQGDVPKLHFTLFWSEAGRATSRGGDYFVMKLEKK